MALWRHRVGHLWRAAHTELSACGGVPIRLKRTQPKQNETKRGALQIPSEVDVLVVGGGINGAGIARDLAGRALSVLLCEQHDLAAHTSSSSTKLIHGGLRYLE